MKTKTSTALCGLLLRLWAMTALLIIIELGTPFAYGQNETAELTFSAESPPLMKDVGIGEVRKIIWGPSRVKHSTMEVEMRDVIKAIAIQTPNIWGPTPSAHLSFVLKHPNACRAGDRMEFKIKRTTHWKKMKGPDTFASDSKIIQVHTFGSSVAQLSVVRTLVAAKASAEGFGLSAEISGELEHTQEEQKNWTEETTQQKEITVESGKTYTEWQFKDTIEFTPVEPSMTIRFDEGGHSVLIELSSEGFDFVVETVGGMYTDSIKIL